MPEQEHNSMRRMQEEAARRAREMQARARHPLPPQGQKQAPATPPPPAPAPPPVQEPPPDPPPPLPLAAPGQPAPGGLLEELFKDRERTMLLALLILLGAEGGNHELMFALLFLLL